MKHIPERIAVPFLRAGCAEGCVFRCSCVASSFHSGSWPRSSLSNFFGNAISEIQMLAISLCLTLLALFGMYGLAAELLIGRAKLQKSVGQVTVAVALRAIPLVLKVLFAAFFAPFLIPVVRRSMTPMQVAGPVLVCCSYLASACSASSSTTDRG